MNNEATMNAGKPNGADAAGTELSTTAANLGARAGSAAATATDLAHTAQEYGQKLSSAATQAKDFIGEKAGVVGDKIKELQGMDLSELGENCKQLGENAKQFARKKPTQAILISAGVGLLLGLILRGRR